MSIAAKEIILGMTPEDWAADLLKAGWKMDGGRTIWRSPWGSLYRGPYAAWAIMNGRRLEAQCEVVRRKISSLNEIGVAQK